MNVTLIGMAGAGKSYIGKRLARRLGFKFVDIDTVLENSHGKNIQALLDEVGEAEYLRRETQALIESSSDRDNLVLSPGGSIIYTTEGVGHLKKNSRVVYLCVPFDVVEGRIKGLPPRAIIGLGKKTLRELYDERHPLYERTADLIVDTEDRDSEYTLKAIIDFLKR